MRLFVMRGSSSPIRRRTVRYAAIATFLVASLGGISSADASTPMIAKQSPGGGSNGSGALVYVLGGWHEAPLQDQPVTPIDTSMQCTYGPALEHLNVSISGSAAAQKMIDEHWVWQDCKNTTTGELTTRMYPSTPGAPAAPAVTGIEVAQAALALITAPEPDFQTSPPRDRNQVVGLRTWIWLTNPTQPLSATAAIGGVSATVSATPAAIRIDPGDGSPAFTCDHPDVAYDPERPSGEPGCSYLYQRRSTSAERPDGTYAMTVSITYDVAWTATTGEGGPLTPLQATSTQNLTVREIQAQIN